MILLRSGGFPLILCWNYWRCRTSRHKFIAWGLTWARSLTRFRSAVVFGWPCLSAYLFPETRDFLFFFCYSVFFQMLPCFFDYVYNSWMFTWSLKGMLGVTALVSSWWLSTMKFIEWDLKDYVVSTTLPQEPSTRIRMFGVPSNL